MVKTSLSYEILGVKLRKKRTTTVLQNENETEVVVCHDCAVDHNNILNFDIVSDPTYCSKNNILYGVKCCTCSKLFVSSNKKNEEMEFDMRK